jgi:AraC-like DNA-binding protein
MLPTRNSVARRAKKPSRRRGDCARLRADFFARIDPAQLLQPLDHLPGVLYFVKDAQSRLMAVSPGSITRLGFKTEADMIGLTDRDLVVPELANKYLNDDQWVLRHGRPLRNIVEMWFNEQGVRDWIITDKYPLRDTRGNIVGLLGTIQTLQDRRGMLAHLGPVGNAVDYIRDHLGEPIRLSEIARHAGFSERQLGRLFRRAFGMTIQQFVIHSRIHAATYELTRSGRTIAEIALMYGFSDQSAFTNQFRDVTGMTPRVYRERYVAELTP